ncbi:ROK family protein [Naumannella cuiyingiana]|uniref:Glucokinase n=1 Tax=Naumannella cuiyingiana TaxID=1347891 RepID=A0A7Z0D7N0_9ACTN|nr:glucokinase [Naumannella cuiyingiana]
MNTSEGPREGERLAVFDIGGTDVKAGLLTDAGLSGVRRVPTPGVPGTDRATDLTALIAELAADADAISVVVPGIVDEAAGVVRFAANLGLREEPLRDRLAAATGLPVALGHDIAAVGVAERRLGAARGVDNVLVLPIGTGIAGVAFVDGHRLRAGGYAGEIGHAPVPGGGPCSCGATGCLETVASAAAIARRFSAESGIAAAGAREVAALLDDPRAGAAARRAWDAAIDALTHALRHCVAVLGPELIVIGGGLAAAGPALLDPLTARLHGALSFHRRPAVVAAQLGPDAGLWGAAILGTDLLGLTALPRKDRGPT